MALFPCGENVMLYLQTIHDTDTVFALFMKCSISILDWKCCCCFQICYDRDFDDCLFWLCIKAESTVTLFTRLVVHSSAVQLFWGKKKSFSREAHSFRDFLSPLSSWAHSFHKILQSFYRSLQSWERFHKPWVTRELAANMAVEANFARNVFAWEVTNGFKGVSCFGQFLE